MLKNELLVPLIGKEFIFSIHVRGGIADTASDGRQPSGGAYRDRCLPFSSSFHSAEAIALYCRHRRRLSVPYRKVHQGWH